MRLTVITSDALQGELLAQGTREGIHIQWLDRVEALDPAEQTDAILDLLYTPAHNGHLQPLLPRPVFVSSVEYTLSQIHSDFVRINGWPTFLCTSVVEAACLQAERRLAVEQLFSFFNKTVEWLPDVTGFVTPRVISMIINEAFLSLREGVSTETDIDTAMKLGTNYPFGPFEWARRIGYGRIQSLLRRLEATDPRYACFVL